VSGDVVVSSFSSDGNWMIKDLEPRQWIERFPPWRPGPLPRVGHAMGDGAGFFSDGWGLLPFTYTRAELDHYDVWRIP
jgi:hypothetical protein